MRTIARANHSIGYCWGVLATNYTYRTLTINCAGFNLCHCVITEIRHNDTGLQSAIALTTTLAVTARTGTTPYRVHARPASNVLLPRLIAAFVL